MPEQQTSERDPTEQEMSPQSAAEQARPEQPAVGVGAGALTDARATASVSGDASGTDFGTDFGPRRAAAGGPNAGPGGYSLFVDAMKWVLPLLAVVVFLAVIIVTSMQKEDDTFSVVIPTEQTETPEERMAAPEMTGFDDKGRPYNVTAERARRDEADDSVIHLEQVTGWMLMDAAAGAADGEGKSNGNAESTQAADLFASGSINPEAQPENQLKIASRTGVLHSNDNLIDLSGDVVMTIGTTYKIATEAATINMHDKTAKSDVATAVTLDWGTVDANSFAADSDAKTVVFTGNVRTTILPKSQLAGR